MSDEEVHGQPPVDEGESPYIFVEGAVNSNYRLGVLAIDREDQTQTVQVVPISEFNQKQLVAVPLSTWHKKVAKRILPAGSFSKPVQVEVLATTEENREEPEADVRIRLWVGFLSQDYFSAVDFSQEEVAADFAFEAQKEGIFFPFAQSLNDLANEHFAFFSAAEEAGGPQVEADASGSADLAVRMDKMETLMKEMYENLKSSRPQVYGPPASIRAPALRATSKAKPNSSSSTAAMTPRRATGNDSGVVEAAFQAGLKPEVLQQVSQLMNKNPKARKVQDVNPTTKVDVLSDLDDEDEDVIPAEPAEFGSELQLGDPLQRAVIQMSNIMQMLSEEKLKKKQSSKLESALEYSGSTPTDGGSIGTGKRSAAARRALRTMLIESPEEIYSLIEKLMAEDVTSQTLLPGIQTPATTSRAWVEHRSHIGAYKTVAHSAWGVAGALDCLKNGQVAAARARLAVLLLQLDQSSIDRGNWVLASELALEAAPPFASLAQHSGPMDGESPYSRLLDSRWAEIALAHLREQEDFQSKRKQLGKIKKDETPNDDAASKRRPKSKAKAKAMAEPES